MSRSRSLKAFRKAFRGMAWGVTLPVIGFMSAIPAKAESFAFLAPSDALILIDGDTLIYDRVRYRLAGIDAPEARQYCETSAGQIWQCGVRATIMLREEIDAHVIRCVGSETDIYGRIVVVCAAEGSEETLNGFMVRHGWAMAYRRYSDAYVDEEDAARREGRGIWSGPMVAPWEWRKGKR